MMVLIMLESKIVIPLIGYLPYLNFRTQAFNKMHLDMCIVSLSYYTKKINIQYVYVIWLLKSVEDKFAITFQIRGENSSELMDY